MLMRTNSAGYSGANPTRMLTIPSATWSGGLFSASHLTRYAWLGVAPAKAPWRYRPCMNAPTFSRMLAHSGSALGSNTTHCVPRRRLSSMYSAVRRTGMYFHWLSAASEPSKVRAPHTTEPVTGKVRRQLSPSGLSSPFWSSVIRTAGYIPPGSEALVPAGAFQTPRELSVVAQAPATAPHEEYVPESPVSGSVAVTRGKYIAALAAGWPVTGGGAMPFFARSTVPHVEGGSTRSIARRLTHRSTASVSGFPPTSDPTAGSRHKMLNRSTVARAPPACTTASSSASVIGEPSSPPCPWTGWPEGVGSGSWSPPDFTPINADDCTC